MTDAVGTTKLETNAGQGVTGTQETEAFGRTIGTTGSTGTPFGYHGSEGYRQYGDGPQGGEPYQRVGARYYDRLTGRFITRDTDLSQSPYAYCDGDPVNCTDPSGHDADGLAAGGVAMGGGVGLVAIQIATESTLFLLGLSFGLVAGVIAIGIATIGLGIYAGYKLGKSIADGLDGAAQDAGLDAPRPAKGIGWQGDKNTSSNIYTPVTGSPGHYKQSGPSSSTPIPGSSVLPPGTTFKPW